MFVGLQRFCQTRSFSMKLLLSSKKIIIQVGTSAFFEYFVCSTYNGFRTCLKLELCGCSHLSLLLFLRHLCRDIDIAQSEGKIQVFFDAFLVLRHPKHGEVDSPPLNSKSHSKVSLSCRILLSTTFKSNSKSMKLLIFL